jgi:hypothetical protein
MHRPGRRPVPDTHAEISKLARLTAAPMPTVDFRQPSEIHRRACGLISGVLAAAHFGISILGVHPLPLELPPGRHRPVRMVAAYMFDVPLVRRLVGQFPQVPKHPA